ncbi:hypothetical protein [Salininema proteolyticum]|uniref:Uncharacterized protein n=1 Tax=Salininema proteolyticum TaxID=1607685 RepID=A0ABV8U1Z6_9ACTN
MFESKTLRGVAAAAIAVAGLAFTPTTAHAGTYPYAGLDECMSDRGFPAPGAEGNGTIFIRGVAVHYTASREVKREEGVVTTEFELTTSLTDGEARHVNFPVDAFIGWYDGESNHKLGWQGAEQTYWVEGDLEPGGYIVQKERIDMPIDAYDSLPTPNLCLREAQWG